jgi:hypothetical protein
VISGDKEADVGMPAANEHGLTQRGPGRIQAPEGVSCGEPPVLAGVLGTKEKLEIEMRDRFCIARRRHDAIVSALNADPAALVIKSPLQSHRAASAMPCLSLVVFVPFACPVTMNEIHDTADLPLDRSRIDLGAHISARQPSAAGSNESVPISLG